MVHVHKQCYSNSTVLLPCLIGTNEVQHYFMLQDLLFVWRIYNVSTCLLSIYCSSNSAYGHNTNYHKYLKL